MKKYILKAATAFDVRDLFVLAGFILLYAGLAERYDHGIAMAVTGAIILAKGLFPDGLIVHNRK